MSLVHSAQHAEVVPIVLQVPGESDSDSGMGSPAEEVVMEAATSKGEDDILVHRKPRCHKAIRDSDEEEEEAMETSVNMADALILAESEEEEESENNRQESMNKKKGRRISRAPVDSEESDLGDGGGAEK
ncbi:hypothetical protein CRUP_019916, partial [Coryphaenoides rupestris]